MYNMLRIKGERKEREGKMKEGGRKGKKKKQFVLLREMKKQHFSINCMVGFLAFVYLQEMVCLKLI